MMKTETNKQSLEPEAASMLPTLRAGEDRVDWLLSSSWLGRNPKAESWRIVMDFDLHGNLKSYWEGTLDCDSEQLDGGGISVIEDER
jgi:hypothetical protein